MDEADRRLRNLTYRRFVELGRAPTASEIAAADPAVALHADSVLAGWRRLHEAHALVLDPGLTDLRMLNPFSVGPTTFVVEAAGRSWYGNCAWDAFGIGAALHVDSVIRTSCPDCGDPIIVEVRDGRPDDLEPGLPRPRPRRRVVGRHRLHLRHHAPLPVGRARHALAGRPPVGRDHERDYRLRPRARMVGHAPRPGLAAAHARGEPGHPDRLGLVGRFWRLG